MIVRPDSVLATEVLPSPSFGDRRGRAIDAIVLHYTGMPTASAALARLRDPAAEVSCHYLVFEDGRIAQLVAERDRAWHAGRGSWAGERDINALSIGIEIVNAGHDGGCPPYPAPQVAAVIALCADIVRRRGIAPTRLLAHSDIAPDRKMDPGEHFPWCQLANAGLVPALIPAPIVAGQVLRLGDTGDAVTTLQRDLGRLGFDTQPTGVYDVAIKDAVTAFQRRHRPTLVDGAADESTRATLATALASLA